MHFGGLQLKSAPEKRVSGFPFQLGNIRVARIDPKLRAMCVCMWPTGAPPSPECSPYALGACCCLAVADTPAPQAAPGARGSQRSSVAITPCGGLPRRPLHQRSVSWGWSHFPDGIVTQRSSFLLIMESLCNHNSWFWGIS